MSHFLLAVIIPKELDNEFLEKHLEARLDQFSENLQVPEYDRDCYCIGSKARKESRKVAEEKHGPFEDLRKAFNSREDITKAREIALGSRELADGEVVLSQDEVTKMWKEHIKAYGQTEQEVVDSHPLKNSPDPECEDCKGTGKYKTCYNPQSKWDWFRVGGRYDGLIAGIEVNSADNGFNFSGIHELPNNNRCDLTEYVNRKKAESNPGCFAILTPENTWCERGSMGWWGMVSDEKDDWGTQGLSILEQYINLPYDIVGVDCHI